METDSPRLFPGKSVSPPPRAPADVDSVDPTHHLPTERPALFVLEANDEELAAHEADGPDREDRGHDDLPDGPAREPDEQHQALPAPAPGLDRDFQAVASL